MRGSASGTETGADGNAFEYLRSLSKRADFIVADVSAMGYLNDLAFGFDEWARKQLEARGGDCVMVVGTNSKLQCICGLLGVEYVSSEAEALDRFDRRGNRKPEAPHP